MKLDRSLQLVILKTLRDKYPDDFESEHIPGYKDHVSFTQNMFYLEEHELIKAGAARRKVFGADPIIITASITAKGLDFLEQDGGLTAILNTITVKLHPEDLCKLLSIKFDKLKIPKEKKDSLMTTIKSLPSETLKKVYMHLIQRGLDNFPDAYHQLQKYLEQLI